MKNTIITFLIIGLISHPLSGSEPIDLNSISANNFNNDGVPFASESTNNIPDGMTYNLNLIPIDNTNNSVEIFIPATVDFTHHFNETEVLVSLIEKEYGFDDNHPNK